MSSHVIKRVLTNLGTFPGKTTAVPELKFLIESMRIVPIESKMLRIGPDGDGGYLVPDDLAGINYCFSPGVAYCSDFELDMANRGMHIFLADKSVAGPAVEDERFSFIPKFIASTTDADAGLITLDDWYRSELGNSVENHPDALLQMDIEGSEYAVLHSVSDSLLNRFRIIIVEFHKLHQLVDRYSFGWMSQALYKILKTHKIVHIHPNNNKKVLTFGGLAIPATLEITFLRNDRVRRTQEILSFPHALDRKCVADKPELVLPDCWF